MEGLTCSKCGNKGFQISPEFDFDTNYIAPICTSCNFPLSKEEYIGQAQEFTNLVLVKALKDAGFKPK